MQISHLVLAVMLCCAVSAQADSLRILPLGDSITQGGKRDREEYTYRWPLFQMLVDAGIEFDFVGSLNKGLHTDAIWPPAYKGRPFDPDHEGVYGIKTARALERLPEAIEKWDAPPDIALIHLGTNDQKAKDHNKAIVEPLREIIGLLREQNPNVIILLGHLNFNGGQALKIRPLVDALAEEMNTESSPVMTVPMYEGWKENPKDPDTDTFDWAHPNPKGQEKMARKWFEALKQFLS